MNTTKAKLKTETALYSTWKERWEITEANAIAIVKEIFRLGGTRPVQKKNIEEFSIMQHGLQFAVELGWLKDCFTESYKLTASGLLMLSHRIKD